MVAGEVVELVGLVGLRVRLVELALVELEGLIWSLVRLMELVELVGLVGLVGSWVELVGLGREGNKPTIVGQSTWRTRHERRQKRCCGCQSKSAKEEQDNTERMIIRRKQTFAAHPTIEERKTVIDGHGPIKVSYQLRSGEEQTCDRRTRE